MDALDELYEAENSKEKVQVKFDPADLINENDYDEDGNARKDDKEEDNEQENK